MYQGFWRELPRPIVGLSPMDGVTDAPMRYITAKYGHPDVVFTEFVSVEGITNGAKRLMRDFRYDESERPVVAQIFGGEPEAFFRVAKLVVEMGFDGVDINMGCPAKKVTGRGEGAGLIKNPALAAEIIEAVKKGVDGKIPVSVKTRIGYDQADSTWWKFLAGQDLAAVTMHGRTFKQLYSGSADWESLAAATKVIRKNGTIFLGNGDIKDIADLRFKTAHFGCDGGLIGRAAMGSPWVFDPAVSQEHGVTVTREEKLRVALEHARKYEEVFPGEAFFPMRKHLAWYCRGFENAAELRQKLVLSNSADEVEAILREYNTL